MKTSITIILVSVIFLFANCKKDETAVMAPQSDNSGSNISNPNPAPVVTVDLSGVYSNSGFTDGKVFGSAKIDSTAETSALGTLKVTRDSNNTDQYVFVQSEDGKVIVFKVVANGDYFNFIPDSFLLNGVPVLASGMKSYINGSSYSYDGFFDQDSNTIFIGIQTSPSKK
jgi:hypothetical protein